MDYDRNWDYIVNFEFYCDRDINVSVSLEWQRVTQSPLTTILLVGPQAEELNWIRITVNLKLLYTYNVHEKKVYTDRTNDNPLNQSHRGTTNRPDRINPTITSLSRITPVDSWEYKTGIWKPYLLSIFEIATSIISNINDCIVI